MKLGKLHGHQRTLYSALWFAFLNKIGEVDLPIVQFQNWKFQIDDLHLTERFHIFCSDQI